MADDIVYDEMLGELRTGDVSGGTGSSFEPVGGEGITVAGGTFTANVATVGFGLQLDGGTASYARYRNIETVSGATVTMQAGHAYKVYATTSAVTINTETIPANQYGQEGHIELFVAGAGYVQTGANVVLANALEPDAVNNCTVRFHDGLAIVSVEDHVAGYIVVFATGNTAGTLPYALSSASQEYVAFDATLNGATVDLSGSTVSGEKHIVGNGYTSTTLTGDIDCGTAKVTVAGLSLQNVGITGGTLTLGDANIPSGSTVAVSGGGLAVEKVSGNGGTIDLNSTHISATTNTSLYASGCTFSGGSATQAGAIKFERTSSAVVSDCSFIDNNASLGGAIDLFATGSSLFENCRFVGNSATSGGGAVSLRYGGIPVAFSSCVFSGNAGLQTVHVTFRNTSDTTRFDNCIFSGNNPNTAIAETYGAIVDISGCTFSTNENIQLTSATYTEPQIINFAGTNKFGGKLTGNAATCKANVLSGAILDLTGNTNTTPINPGGGVIVDGGCQVITSAGTTVSIAGGTYTKINNDGTTE